MNQHIALAPDAIRISMPLDVYAAAAQRSRHIPGPDTIAAAWGALSPAEQERIGALALSLALNSWLWSDETQDPADRWLTDEATQAAGAQSDRDYDALLRVIEGTVPALFGSGGQDPAWSTGRAFSLPSPVIAAIDQHRRAWSALGARYAFLDIAGQQGRPYAADQMEGAEDEAFTDLNMLSCRDHVEAGAMLAHLQWYRHQRTRHPLRQGMSDGDAALVAVRLADLAVVLNEPAPEGAASVLPPGELVGRIGVHRAAWTTLRDAPRHERFGTQASRSEAADEAADAVLNAPCSSRSDAAALVEHAIWYARELESADDGLTDGLGYSSRLLSARARDLMLAAGSPV